MIDIEKFYDSLFIGRRRELGQMLAAERIDTGCRPVINVHGQGGIGKTKLLHQLLKLYSKTETGVDLVDLRDSRNQSELGLLMSIAHFVGSGDFGAFEEAVRSYESVPSSDRAALRDRAVAVFRRCFEAVATHRQICIPFDTYDKDTAAIGATRHLLSEHLPWMTHTNAIIVIAGRRTIPENAAYTCQAIHLDPFDATEVGEILRAFYARDQLRFPVQPSDVRQVIELTEGKPILVALAAEWLVRGNTFAARHGSRSAFIDDIMRATLANTPGSRELIQYMAALPRHFTPELLSYVTSEPVETCDERLTPLRAMPFVKHNRAADSYSLHDEIRQMVMAHWQFAPGTTAGIWANAQRYYATILTRVKNREERVARLAEYVEIAWMDDPVRGFQQLQRHFEDALEAADIELCKALVETTRRMTMNKRQSAIATALEAELGLLEYNQELLGRFAEAKTVLATELEWAARLEFDIGRAYALRGDMEAAIVSLRGSCALFESLGNEEGLRRSAAVLGDAYFWTGVYENAVEYLRKVVDMARKARDERRVAEALSTLGNVRRRQGQHADALELCKEADQLARAVSFPREVGHAQRNLANVLRDLGRLDEANELYEAALLTFADMNDRLGEARTLSEYAWALFVQGAVPKSEDMARRSIALKEEYHFNNEIATTRHTLFEILVRTDPRAALVEIEEVYRLSVEYNDGFMLFDSVAHWALLQWQLGGSHDAILTKLEELDSYARRGYRFLLFHGRVHVLAGNIAVRRRDAPKALLHYLTGLRMIVDQGGTATGRSAEELMIAELRLISEELRGADDSLRGQVMDGIGKWWSRERLGLTYPSISNIEVALTELGRPVALRL